MLKKVSKRRLSVDNFEMPYVTLKIFEEDNKFKYTIYDFDDKEKILFDSNLDFANVKEAKENAYKIIEEKFADPNYDEQVIKAMCEINSRD